MKGTNLGEFEELVLLVVASLFDDAYGISIQKAVKEQGKRSVSISTVHATLHRLKQKGYLDSRYDGTASSARGGRPKLLFRVTKSGYEALANVRALRNNLWDSIPDLGFG